MQKRRPKKRIKRNDLKSYHNSSAIAIRFVPTIELSSGFKTSLHLTANRLG